MSKRQKEHAERNKELSKILHSGKKYYDWVITTAFYSSIHFIENKILPCKVEGHPCKDITDVMKSYKMKGRHASRERLACEKLDLRIAVMYKWLDDRSRYSRYVTYKITPTEADKAIEYLNNIHEACCP